MKKMTLPKFSFAIPLLFVAILKSYTQQLDYGIFSETNFASHTHINPTKPQDGLVQWNTLTTFGIGLYASKQIHKHIHGTTSLVFRQRGYTEEAQTGPIFSPIINYQSLQNKFYYISLESKIKYLKNTNNKIKISPIAGISLNTLLKQKLESEKIDEINDVYPVNLYKGNWHRFNINYVIGLSLFQLNRYSLDFIFSRSITPLLSEETLVVKDWIWSADLSISLQRLLKKDEKDDIK